MWYKEKKKEITIAVLEYPPVLFIKKHNNSPYKRVISFILPYVFSLEIKGKNGIGKTFLLMHLLKKKTNIGYISTVSNIVYFNLKDKIHQNKTILFLFISKIYLFFFICFQVFKIFFIISLIKKNLFRYENFSNGQFKIILNMFEIILIDCLLILDEPFTGLDMVTIMLLKNLLKTNNYIGKSILYVNHQEIFSFEKEKNIEMTR